MTNHLTRLGKAYVPIVWIEFFRFFLQWSDEQIMEWAIPFQDDLLDENSLMYHDSLVTPIAGLLIPAALLGPLSAQEKLELCNRLGRALCGLEMPNEPQPGWDWATAATNINTVLSSYGYSLVDINKDFRWFDFSRK